MGHENETPPTQTSWDLTGDLTKMPLIAVLQFLEMGRQSGMLLVTSPDGASHQSVLREGGVVEAVSRHLRGAEALLAMLDLKTGKFAFSVREPSSAQEPSLALSPLIMEVVRLEDELERLLCALPGDSVPLALRNPHEVPVDPLECGADTVMAMIAARPGITLVELQATAPLARPKVRLAAAWLSFTDRMRSQQSMTGLPRIAPMAGCPPWYSRLLLLYPGGPRVLVGLSRLHAAHDAITSIRELAKGLDSGPAWMSIAPDDSAMARVRPNAGGLVSIACIPLDDAHHEAFKGLCATAALVFICQEESAEAFQLWRDIVPPRARVSRLICNPGPRLLESLRQFAEGTEAQRDAPKKDH
ncbi:MAG: DUF4388 domain-containing protein [Myxococcales bacterium]